MEPWRVIVFIDYQNVYYRARGQFFTLNDPPTAGHVDPLKLGELLFELGRRRYPNRVLAGVRVYKGRTDRRSGEKVHRSDDRRMGAWEQMLGVEVFSRPLTYHTIRRPGGPTKWQPQEKGIDVMLALDLAIGARNDAYEVAVVFSSDSDLLPALEDASARKHIETAVWGSPDDCIGPLRAKGQSTWTHYLSRREYDRVSDNTNYLTYEGC